MERMPRYLVQGTRDTDGTTSVFLTSDKDKARTTALDWLTRGWDVSITVDAWNEVMGDVPQWVD